MVTIKRVESVRIFSLVAVVLVSSFIGYMITVAADRCVGQC